MENKQRAVAVTAEVPNEGGDPLEEEATITSGQLQEIKEPEETEKTVTLEQVQAVLMAKKDEGKNMAIKELLQKYGTTRLTDIDPARYARLLKEAEAL